MSKRVMRSRAEALPVARCHVVEALPAGQLPHPRCRPQREVHAGVLGRHQLHRTAHRPVLDDQPSSQGLVDLAGSRALSPEPDRELGRRRYLGWNGTKPAHHTCDRFGADGIQQMLPQAPCECLRPADGHRVRRPDGSGAISARDCC